MVEEAGGKTSLVSGEVHDLVSSDFVATNSLIQDELIEVLNK